MIAEKLDGASLDRVAALDEVALLRQDEAQHPDRVRVRRYEQTHGSP